ncbi:hypothetical protein [Azoarcus taiwanensis]|uniref:Uncharacterized protein n=1 Tax=Azoarcus taiwanensis TaxID=666964 RepID=A0A972JCD4_9RHOO|nr:hypothetical protein [Azoarcus taiwanensis]NMG05063.1 hypothetical protein [Azoarcus taiwanensis]
MKNLHTDPRENAPVKHTVTPSDLQQIQQRRIEQHEHQQAADALNLHRAAKLGDKLKKLTDGQD